MPPPGVAPLPHLRVHTPSPGVPWVTPLPLALRVPA